MPAFIQRTERDLELMRREVGRVGAAPDPWIGRVLADRYRVVRHLADGGMARVYAGEQVALGLEVAIKILDRESSADDATAGRFEREAISTAQLRCPHVVQVFDWGTLPEGGHFLVMELVPGRDLASVLMSGGLLGLRRTLGVLRQLANAIDHAHAHGIVHRDLKPENVMIDEDAEDFVKVLDFGVSRDLRVERSFSRIGEVIGTPEYMSPEQALGLTAKVGPASDRYALAAMALEMLTGDLPYPSAPATATLRMIADSPPRRPSELGLELPGLDAVLDRAMARHPGDRYPSARAFVDALEDVLAPLVSARRSHPDDISGVRRRVDSNPIESSSSVPSRPIPVPAPLFGAAAITQMPTDEASMARIATAMVLAGLALVGSAFAAGWVACLALAG